METLAYVSFLLLLVLAIVRHVRHMWRKEAQAIATA